jgi:hypothetical protein
VAKPLEIAADKTEAGETAPEITALLDEDGTFYIQQMHGSVYSDPPDARVSVVGMSREQAKKVRDALNRLLEPI